MLELKNISLSLGSFSLKSVSFLVERGDYFILLGVSGAGKSMILETIAGLVTPRTGSIILDGKDITGTKIQNRKTGLVFQDHAIFPHMSVRENIAYSLHGRSFTKQEKQKKIESVAEQMNITAMLDRRPGTLSGGELQRVALARTLVQEPDILLLDEPLASVDVQIKNELRRLLRQLNRAGQTIIHVTHDYDEAVSLGNKIAVVHNGSIVQMGTPEEVFHNPSSEFVAHFTGTRNFFRVRVTGNEMITEEGSVMLKVPHEGSATEGFIIIRNEDIFLSSEPVETSVLNNYKGIITDIVPTRTGVEVSVDIGIIIHVLITQESRIKMNLSEGMPVWIHFKASAVKFIP